MKFNENSVLSTINPVLLLLGFVLVVAISAFSAWRYRDTCDLKKSLRLAMVQLVILAAGCLLAGLPFFVVAGYGICTFVFTSWFSNYYFYK